MLLLAQQDVFTQNQSARWGGVGWGEVWQSNEKNLIMKLTSVLVKISKHLDLAVVRVVRQPPSGGSFSKARVDLTHCLDVLERHQIFAVSGFQHNLDGQP